MKYDFSVIVMTYHPIKSKLLSTLNSIALQENISLEIIIADDGSGQFYRDEIVNFMGSKHFSHYQILAHSKNQGTVKNLIDALAICHGQYIKVISPGDYLYSKRTLADIFSFMEQHQAKAIFSEMAYYSYENQKLQIHNITNPWDCSVYSSGAGYNAHKVIQHMTIYSDPICGAGIFAERELFETQLRRIQDIVIYAEDLTFQLIALLGCRIWKYPKPAVWYEYGSGISTNGNLGFSPRLRADFLNFTKWLHETYPENSDVKIALKLRMLLEEKRYSAIHAHKLLHWGELMFAVKKRLLIKKYKAPKYDEALFYAFYLEASD